MDHSGVSKAENFVSMDILAKFSSLKDGMDGKDGMESILILDELGTENSSSVEECANWCTYNPDCYIFEYSPPLHKSSKYFLSKFGSTQLSLRGYWLDSAQLEELLARTIPNSS